MREWISGRRNAGAGLSSAGFGVLMAIPMRVVAGLVRTLVIGAFVAWCVFAPVVPVGAEELPQIKESRAFKVLGVADTACGAARCLEFTILCKRNFYHGRIAGLLLRATWYGPDGVRQRTTVNQDGSCGIGGEITRTRVPVPGRESGLTYTVESLFE